jgi:hypothetical protein
MSGSLGREASSPSPTFQAGSSLSLSASSLPGGIVGSGSRASSGSPTPSQAGTGPIKEPKTKEAQLVAHLHAKLVALLIASRAVPAQATRKRKPDVWFNLELWEPEGAKEASSPWRVDLGTSSTRGFASQPGVAPPNRMVIEVVARGGRLRVGDGRGGFKEVDARDGVLLETWSLSRT